MNETLEYITKGLSVDSTITDPTEPVTLAEAKLYISMDNALDVHNSTIERHIKSCRKAVEDKTGVALVARSNVVSWIELYDSELLPYLPVKKVDDDYPVIVTDLDGTALEGSFRGVGGFLTIVGNYPDGVTISYDSGYTVIPDQFKDTILAMVKDVFVNDMSISDALLKHAKTLSK